MRPEYYWLPAFCGLVLGVRSHPEAAQAVGKAYPRHLLPAAPLITLQKVVAVCALQVPPGACLRLEQVPFWPPRIEQTPACKKVEQRLAMVTGRKPVEQKPEMLPDPRMEHCPLNLKGMMVLHRLILVAGF